MDQVSVIIPAYNEEQRIQRTICALKNAGDWIKEIIVVDDGSSDNTFLAASTWTEKAIRLPQNVGKAKAIEAGCRQATQPILLFIDADLVESASLARKLVEPLWEKKADMTVAIFPQATNGGFGLVKNLASWGIYNKTGKRLVAPLCGQRAIRSEVFGNCYQGDQGFGIEVGLSLDCLLAGYTVKEVAIDFSHRETGKSIQGFMHRFKQGVSVCQALFTRR